MLRNAVAFDSTGGFPPFNGVFINTMPPKPKLTKDDIINVAFTHVRKHGWEGLTARFISEQLNTSTKPIYFHFPSMQAIEEIIVKKALDIIHGYTAFTSTNDPWLDQALKVVMFAVEEKHLWRAMNDENNEKIDLRAIILGIVLCLVCLALPIGFLWFHQIMKVTSGVGSF